MSKSKALSFRLRGVATAFPDWKDLPSFIYQKITQRAGSGHETFGRRSHKEPPSTVQQAHDIEYGQSALLCRE
jgi:hypothetical protein